MRQLPKVYSQRDARWADQRLGTSNGTTIGQYGCYITCFSMTATYFGHEITPNALDDIFTNRNLYVAGNLLTDDGLTKVYPDIKFVKIYDYADSSADLNLLKQSMDDSNQLVILEVDFDHNPLDGIQTHFAVCVEADGGTGIKIADPWYGSLDDFALHYGTDPAKTILKFVVYTGTANNTTNVSIESNTFQKLVHNSTEWDLACDYFGLPRNSEFLEVQKKYEEVKTNLTNAEKDTASSKQQAVDLATEIKKIQEDDSQLATRNIDLEHQVTAATNDLKDIASPLSARPTKEDILKMIDRLKKAKTVPPDTFLQKLKALFGLR